jgi:uncharacterized protein (TIGR02453 family)
VGGAADHPLSASGVTIHVPRRLPPWDAAGREGSLFTADTFTFLEELAANNEREWFEANKARYERTCREPALALIRELGPRLHELAPRFVADDRKVGGSLMRLHRDTRFSKDKSPYKTNLGLQFRHEGGADVHAPGIYLHVAADENFLGVGSWMPEPPVLDHIRRALVADPDAWRAATTLPGWDTDGGEGAGERLKRVPRGFDPSHPLAEQLKKKSHLATRALSRDELVGEGVADRVAAALRDAVPYLRWLTTHPGAARDRRPPDRWPDPLHPRRRRRHRRLALRRVPAAGGGQERAHHPRRVPDHRADRRR